MRAVVAALACSMVCEAAPTAQVSSHMPKLADSTWQCPLTNCVLKSPLANAGPAFPDGVRFFTTSKDGLDHRAACPFGGDANEEGKEPTTKEYMKYMKAMDKLGDMTSEERIAWAVKHQYDHLNDPVVEPKIKEPRIDVTKPGVEAVNSTTWSELRRANKFDFLIAFYAPWCPHCKAFVTSETAPLKALSAQLEKLNGPKVVEFDVIADTAPLVIEAVPTVYLFKKSGEAVPFEGNGNDMKAMINFALQKPNSALVEKQVSQHLRKA